jgi:hypothetical protein
MLGHIIDYRSSGGGSFIFNDKTAITTANWVSPFYYIQVTSVDGHFGADISYESHPIPNAIGEKSGDVFRRGKTLTFSGTIYGRGLSEIYSGADFLQQMLAEKTIRKLVFIPWNHGIQLYYNCRPFQDLSITEQFDSEVFKFPFVFGLRADDPRSYTLSGNTLFPSWQA